MMKINVLQAKKVIGSRQPFHFITSADKLAIDGDNPWTGGDIEVRGEVVNNGRVLEVKGIMYAKSTYSCNRCLDEFSTFVEVPFAENYQESDMEISGSEDELVYYQGDEIDILDLLRESLILAELLKPLCSEECRGLCPQCGANLNVKQCSCESQIIDPRLAVLQQLLPKK
jgi:uncharacterized protein